MGLFSKKKPLQPMPAFPQFPSQQPMQDKAPSYKPEIPDNINHVDDFHTSPEAIDIPKLPDMGSLNDNFPKFPDDTHSDESLPSMPVFDNPPDLSPQDDIKPAFTRDTNKPLFIKIEDYRDSIANIELLRSKIKETEDYLEKLNDIKLAEEEELRKCRKNIDMIKQKLISVDKKLFES